MLLAFVTVFLAAPKPHHGEPGEVHDAPVLVARGEREDGATAFMLQPPGADVKAHTTEADNKTLEVGGGCPKHMGGLLYNHISKTGGTAFKELLRLASGHKYEPDNVSFVDINDHITSTDPRVGPLGALVVQDDLHHDLQVSGRDANHFFVVGLVRRPCDYMLSSWAYMSAHHSGHELATLGTSPPYSNADDKTRFARFVESITKQVRVEQRTSGVWRFMSYALKERVPHPAGVHCWVRTHAMVPDLRRCLQQYKGCGGHVDDEHFTAAEISDALERANRAIPSDPTAACSSFFNETMMESVMQSEGQVISRYDLGSCCS